MSEQRNFRIKLNLTHFYYDHRSYARIFINESIKKIQDLKEKITRIFNLEEFQLVCHNEFLPSGEDIRILEKNDVVLVLPVDEKRKFKKCKESLPLPDSSDFDEKPAKVKNRKRKSTTEATEAETNESESSAKKNKKSKNKFAIENKLSTKLETEAINKEKRKKNKEKCVHEITGSSIENKLLIEEETGDKRKKKKNKEIKNDATKSDSHVQYKEVETEVATKEEKKKNKEKGKYRFNGENNKLESSITIKSTQDDKIIHREPNKPNSDIENKTSLSNLSSENSISYENEIRKRFSYNNVDFIFNSKQRTVIPTITDLYLKNVKTNLVPIKKVESSRSFQANKTDFEESGSDISDKSISNKKSNTSCKEKDEDINKSRFSTDQRGYEEVHMEVEDDIKINETSLDSFEIVKNSVTNTTQLLESNIKDVDMEITLNSFSQENIKELTNAFDIDASSAQNVIKSTGKKETLQNGNLTGRNKSGINEALSQVNEANEEVNKQMKNNATNEICIQKVEIFKSNAVASPHKLQKIKKEDVLNKSDENKNRYSPETTNYNVMSATQDSLLGGANNSAISNSLQSLKLSMSPCLKSRAMNKSLSPIEFSVSGNISPILKSNATCETRASTSIVKDCNTSFGYGSYSKNSALDDKKEISDINQNNSEVNILPRKNIADWSVNSSASSIVSESTINISRISDTANVTNRSKKVFSGIGNILGQLRESESDIKSSPSPSPQNGSSGFVTKRKRTRVRKRKTQRNDTPVPVQIHTIVRPLNTHSKPAMHIKFDSDESSSDMETSDNIFTINESIPTINLVINDSVSTNDSVTDLPKAEETQDISSRISCLRTELYLKTEHKFDENSILKYPTMNVCLPSFGEVIAFKILRITESYTPEISSYIVGKVLKFCEETKEVTFKILYGLGQCITPAGKLSMDTTEDDVSDTVRFMWVEDILEPRKIQSN